MRPVYRRRRDALLVALARHLPWLQPVGVSAGLHLVTWLPPHLDEAAVAASQPRARAGRAGNVSGVAHNIGQGRDSEPGRRSR